jgi:predicted acylesterase/phospholipase RssA
MDEEPIISEANESKIKHIVICGGGITCFMAHGALKASQELGAWQMDDIISIHGTSAGAISGLMLVLKYDWATLDDFIIKRPWHSIFTFDINSILGAFQSRGILDIKVVEQIYLPLFKGKDISINVTMKELYDITGIDLHLYSTELEGFTLEDISHKTHPDWRAVDAVYCSCCLPGLFPPYLKDGKIYADGGFLANYPLAQCIEHGANRDEILGLQRILENGTTIDETSSLLDYILYVVNKTIEKNISNKVDVGPIPNELGMASPFVSIYDIYKATSNQDERIRLIKLGADVALAKYG